jgi:hypothetical protein
MYDSRNKLTDELRVLSRLIELPPDHELVEKITHHSNNQNSISARDMQSNSTIQRRLQKEFESVYRGKVFYRIKRGEKTKSDQEIIDNDEAGRLLLAFDLKQPWTCHQSYKILDELHSEIFARKEVTARRINAISDIHQVIRDCMNNIEMHVLSKYRLAQYFILFLLRQAIEKDSVGKAFCENPGEYVRKSRDRALLKKCVKPIIKDLIIDLNAEIRDREEKGALFDYKRELKSITAVRELSHSIMPSFQKAVERGRAKSFGSEWENGHRLAKK